jgi:hypothetical protein
VKVIDSCLVSQTTDIDLGQAYCLAMKHQLLICD